MTASAIVAPPIITLDEVDSTNAEARRLAEAGECGPLWVTARRQTEGRGRRGRPWMTGDRNLAASLLTCTERPPAEAAQVSFVAALAVCDLVRAYLPADTVRLKWPNDVLADGYKVAGILIESGKRPDGRLWLAVGVGVNLAVAPADADRPAVAIARKGVEPPSPENAIKLLSERFEVWSRMWQDFGFEPIAAAWTERAYGLGGPCLARLPHEEISGVAEGLDPDGALRLRLADDTLRRVSAGDVFFEAV